MTRIDCPRKNFTSVPSLAPYVNLTYLRLNENFLTTIEGLSALTQLESLFLNDNRLTDIGDLSALTQLEWLYLNNNRLTDIGDISGFKNLIGFNLEGLNNRIPCRSVPRKFRANSGCK